MRCRSVMWPERTGCSPTWKATSSTAAMANMVCLLSRGIPSASAQHCFASATNTTGAAGRPVALAYVTPHSPGVPGHHQLCNSHAAGDAEWFLGQIDQDHADFAAIIGIDGAGRIGHGNTVPGRQARARPHLGFETNRQGDRNAGGDDAALQRPELDILVDGGQEVG